MSTISILVDLPLDDDRKREGECRAFARLRLDPNSSPVHLDDALRQLAEKGIALAGPAAPRWWWWATAKDYYHKGEYDKALEFFRRSYNEQNWLDHLHLIYTLPYLDRIDDARAQIPILLKLKPDMSVRQADRYYKMWCFQADFRQRMTTALVRAGLRQE